MKKIIYVTRTQIDAAKLSIELSMMLGEPVAPAMYAIANAKRAKKRAAGAEAT